MNSLFLFLVYFRNFRLKSPLAPTAYFSDNFSEKIEILRRFPLFSIPVGITGQSFHHLS